MSPELCKKQNICVKDCARYAHDFLRKRKLCTCIGFYNFINYINENTNESEASVVRIYLVQQCEKFVYITIIEVKENLDTKRTHIRKNGEKYTSTTITASTDNRVERQEERESERALKNDKASSRTKQ